MHARPTFIFDINASSNAHQNATILVLKHVLFDGKQVITTFGPRKPQRQSSNANSSIASDILIDPTADGHSHPIDISTAAAAAVASRPPSANGALASAFASPTSSTSSSAATPSSSRLVTPASARKTGCLETSFTSLQTHAGHPSALLPPPSLVAVTHTISVSRSATPRSTKKPQTHRQQQQQQPNGSKDNLQAPHSQLSSILQYDVTSLHDDASELPNGRHARSQASAKLPPPPQSRQRSVAFDTTGAPRTNGPPTRKPIHSLAGGKRSHSDLSRQRVDLVYDDWYGMAPLASPETLSEISSISSRTSLVNTVASSIEKYLQRVSFYPDRTGGRNGTVHGPINDSDSEPELSAVPEDTQLCTPRIMRRTPKIAGNLAGCADDWRSVDTYKRMGKVFVTGSLQQAAGASNGSNSASGIESSEQSFESANSMGFAGRDGTAVAEPGASRSVDRLDGPPATAEILMSAAKLTWSDGDILGDACQAPRCPHCPCRYYRSGSDCCPQLEHAFCVRPMANGPAAAAGRSGGRRFGGPVNSGSSDGTFYSAESSQQRLDGGALSSSSSLLSALASPAQRVQRVQLEPRATMVLESHFPCNVAEEDEEEFEEEEEEYEDGEERSSLLTPRSATSTNTGSAATILLLQTDVAAASAAASASSVGPSTGASMRRPPATAVVAAASTTMTMTASVTGGRRKEFGASPRWTDDDDDDSNGGCGGSMAPIGGGVLASASGARFTRNESSLPLLAKTLAASLNSRGLSSKRNRNVVYPVLSSYSRNASPVHQQRQTISSSSSSVASTKGGESSV